MLNTLKMSPIISVPVSYELCILCVLILWIFLILIFWSLLAFRWKILSKPWWFPQKRRDIRRVWPGVFNYKYFSCVHSIPRYAISLLFAKKFILEQEMIIHSSSLAWKIPWQKSLAGYSWWGCKESSTTEYTLARTRSWS